MTSQITLVLGAFFGMLSIILGAFGAHALKKSLTKEQLKNFETGVKYQMYHALVLLLIGFNIKTPKPWIVWCFVVGIIFFSFSIYGLVLSDSKGKKLTFLGPVTPLGGLLLLVGWTGLLFTFLSTNIG